MLNLFVKYLLDFIDNCSAIIKIAITQATKTSPFRLTNKGIIKFKQNAQKNALYNLYVVIGSNKFLFNFLNSVNILTPLFYEIISFSFLN